VYVDETHLEFSLSFNLLRRVNLKLAAESFLELNSLSFSFFGSKMGAELEWFCGV